MRSSRLWPASNSMVIATVAVFRDVDDRDVAHFEIVGDRADGPLGAFQDFEAHASRDAATERRASVAAGTR